jgi:restriction endonuclease S subunit
LPIEQLPQLTDEQRAVAKKLGIAEQDYARSLVAGERNREALLAKTERLARLLEERLAASGIDGKINRVVLRTIQDRFDVEIQVNGRVLPLRIEETVVDDYFDSGSPDAEQRLAQILDRALVGLRQ